ncbi:hypothetical protein GCM10010954_09330 [Halobacillus andaensis]|uniref:Putative peptidoglycan binding domain-containing protein n=1 Tax=Halobacillus andaensis TaxID=1176239 RepID=A0A917B0X2_HALAA|nr:DUF1028 domain-containing protein [Halobacillus andaensis]MBP2003723.1 putative Ntn-hydrolase superfamily protein [Halobacillus andaensis]GGF12724.1 hypothetical protein GCM10010954_09330 [Halobacillus andaensis]
MSKIIATFSIVGIDPETGEVGVAVQSKFLGVGSVVPWAKAGVGAVATQAFANPSYGPDGLKYLREGLSAQETIDELIKHDEGADDRQVGVVDAKGNAATFTGESCYEWAGGVTGKHYAAQGNILVNKETVTEMGKTFEKSEGSLADRLLAGLKAAQQAGGDSRGKQSAAIYVEKEKAGYGASSDVLVDLRVDDHPEPIEELERIYELHQLYFAKSKPEEIVALTGSLKEEVAVQLNKAGYLNSVTADDQLFYEGLTTFLHTENFEEREQERGYIDTKVVDYLKQMNG